MPRRLRTDAYHLILCSRYRWKYNGDFAYTLNAIFNRRTSYFKRFVSDNASPECGNLHGTITKLWPPNRAYQSVEIFGVDDPNEDPVTLRIVRVTQDEPLDDRDRDDLGDANATVVGTNVEL